MLDFAKDAFDDEPSSQTTEQTATDDQALLDAYSNAVIGVTERLCGRNGPRKLRDRLDDLRVEMALRARLAVAGGPVLRDLRVGRFVFRVAVGARPFTLDSAGTPRGSGLPESRDGIAEFQPPEFLLHAVARETRHRRIGEMLLVRERFPRTSRISSRTP